MCDPLVGGLIAGAASLASGAMEASQQQELADTQNQANDQWVAYQMKIHRDQVAMENEARQRADAARQDTLSKVSPAAQKDIQTTEQQRLNTLYTNPSGKGSTADPNYAASQLLSGEKGGPQSSIDSITSQVNQATSAARGRIAALATAGSYGGSFGGLGTVIPQTFAQGGNAINEANAERRGDLATYGVEQQVQPLTYAAGPGAGMFGSIAKALGGIAGSGLGNAAASAWGGGDLAAAAAPNWTLPTATTAGVGW
jgi:hypothetical protein